LRIVHVTYRIPSSLFRYVIFAAVITLLAVVGGTWATVGLDGTLAGVGAVALVLIGIVVLRICRLGTVVTVDGITRLGFFGDTYHPWSQVHGLEVVDRQVVHLAYGFQVSSRFVVTAALGPRRSHKTLVFLDERAVGLARLQEELNTVAALWEQGRA
jgi:hypothetical protein